MIWWLTWNVNTLDNIKQGWVPGGWWWGDGFGPNRISLPVLIGIKIRIKTRLWQFLLTNVNLYYSMQLNFIQNWILNLCDMCYALSLMTISFLAIQVWRDFNDSDIIIWHDQRQPPTNFCPGFGLKSKHMWLKLRESLKRISRNIH